MQISSRLLIVLGVLQVLPNSPANFSWIYFSLCIAWSITEVIRYYYYAVNILTEGNPPYMLKWLRYSTFLVLYPLGISSEWGMLYLSLNEAKETVGIVYWAFFVANLVIYFPGSYVMYTYMLKQRKKALNPKKKVVEEQKKTN
ncbi:unnamed protein product [Ambrosiozyma monospora]|uniref:Unnamed protein product n=1 Tax=Ambrosiozyma monospora TaxID=43982 RepID=A0ACB5UC10_AMBMO|nr:unnamed protein product [Ambrosiozyma monospora]